MYGRLVYIGGSILALAAGLLLLYCVYLVSRALWSLMRGRRCKEFAEMAAKKYREGDVSGAVSLFLKAEANWALNRWDGGRESWTKDLDRLGSIASGFVRALAREPGTTYSDFNATLSEMRGLLRERRNFGIDGRKMLPEVTVRWNASLDRLNSLRKRLREISNPKFARR